MFEGHKDGTVWADPCSLVTGTGLLGGHWSLWYWPALCSLVTGTGLLYAHWSLVLGCSLLIGHSGTGLLRTHWSLWPAPHCDRTVHPCVCLSGAGLNMPLTSVSGCLKRRSCGQIHGRENPITLIRATHTPIAFCHLYLNHSLYKACESQR